jgi:ferrous iron transport protein B
MRNTRPARLLLAGNPNAGKTSVFNELTGAYQRVANYPGVTVEKRQGFYQSNGTRFEVVDLPGAYSLTSFTPEERIAQEEILNANGSIVVVVVDSSNLKRSLVLLTQVMLAGANPVLCLNMADEARDAGQSLDLEQLQALLGFPVVETVANRGQGIDDLRAAIAHAEKHPVTESRLRLGERLDGALAEITAALAQTGLPVHEQPWTACKLLLDDPASKMRAYQEGDAGRGAVELASRLRGIIEAETGMDIALFLTEREYGFVDGLLKEVTFQAPRENARELSDKIDSVLVHRFWGLPFFFAVMYGVFWLTFTVGEVPMGWIESGFALLGGWVGGLWPAGSESPLRSLIVDGIIGGVGGVLVFLPNILLLFMSLAFLEDTGYLARAAFLVDRFMHRLGLHGRSFLPLVTGFGCSIPGIMATRTLENERDRLTTMLVLPLMSCGARLTIWMLLIPAFFAPHLRAPMLWLIYVIGIVLALGLAMLLRQTVLKGEDAPFVMELPPYRMPTTRAIWRKLFERGGVYVRKAGTVILGISIVMWFITAYPKPSSYRIDEAIAAGEVSGLSEVEIEDARMAEELRYSIAGRMGGLMEPVIKPLGFDWKLGTALVGAFAAKEVFVAQMGIVYSLGEADESSTGLRAALRSEYTPLIAFSLMIFLLIGTPCLATIAITRRESGGWKWALVQFGGLTAIAYLLSFVVYQVGSLFA